MRLRVSRLGLSLIEMVVSLALLGVMVIFLLNLLPASINTIRQAEMRSQASKLVRSKLEDYAATPFDQLTVGNTTLPDATVEGGSVQWSLSVYAIYNTDSNYIKGLQISASWVDQGVIHSLSQDLWVHHLPQEPTRTP